MLLERLAAPALGAALAATSLAGCFVDTAPGGKVIVTPAESGLLTVLWTVDGTTDASACDDYGASDLRLQVFDQDDYVVGDVLAPCEDFEVTLELPEGHYYGEARLVGPELVPVSTTLPLENIRIVSDTELTIDTDFPAGSIL